MFSLTTADIYQAAFIQKKKKNFLKHAPVKFAIGFFILFCLLLSE